MLTSENRIRRQKLQHEAEGYLELDMPDHALGALARLGDPAGFDAQALYLLGEALRAKGRYQEALVPLRRVAAATPENVHAWLALGWCHKRTGRIDRAIEPLEAALDVEPDHPLVHFNLACYWSLAGNKPNALEYLSRALTIEPDYHRLIDDEPDFDPIRFDPEFQALCAEFQASG